MKTIYDLKLHETLSFAQDSFSQDVVVTRVSGGWIYNFKCGNNRCCFVPYDNEFQKNSEVEKGGE